MNNYPEIVSMVQLYRFLQRQKCGGVKGLLELISKCTKARGYPCRPRNIAGILIKNNRFDLLPYIHKDDSLIFGVSLQNACEDGDLRLVKYIVAKYAPIIKRESYRDSIREGRDRIYKYLFNHVPEMRESLYAAFISANNIKLIKWALKIDCTLKVDLAHIWDLSPEIFEFGLEKGDFGSDPKRNLEQFLYQWRRNDLIDILERFTGKR